MVEATKYTQRDLINKIRQVQHASEKLPVGVWSLVGDGKKTESTTCKVTSIRGNQDVYATFSI